VRSGVIGDAGPGVASCIAEVRPQGEHVALVSCQPKIRVIAPEAQDRASRLVKLTRQRAERQAFASGGNILRPHSVEIASRRCLFAQERSVKCFTLKPRCTS